MRALVVLALVLGAVALADPAAATVYVPGQYKDGIYIRPHFLDFPVRPSAARCSCRRISRQSGTRSSRDSMMLQLQPMPQKRPQLPAS